MEEGAPKLNYYQALCKPSGSFKVGREANRPCGAAWYVIGVLGPMKTSLAAAGGASAGPSRRRRSAHWS